jgi:hypothetical protein
VRLWGSLGFILASTGAGWLIARRRRSRHPLILGAWPLALLTSFGLPQMPRHRHNGGGMLTLLSDRRFVLMLATSCSIQCFYAVLDAFVTL